MSAPKSHLTPAQVFGRRVREARERRGWTQGELADRVGLERTGINKIEGGTRGDVSISQLFKFADVLEISPVHLLTPRHDDADVVIVPGKSGKTMNPRAARRWIRGTDPPASVERFLDLPRDEQQQILYATLTSGMDQLVRALMANEITARVETILQQLEQRKEK